MKRLYSLFAKINGKDHRVSMCAYTLNDARRIYQNSLLNGSFSGIPMNLKPIKNGMPEFNQTAYDEYQRLQGFKKCRHCWEYRSHFETGSEICRQCEQN